MQQKHLVVRPWFCDLVACVASVSSRGSSRNLGQEQKKLNYGGGGGERRNRLPANPTIFEKLRSPTNAAFDWRSTASVDYLAFETSIKPGMLCFRASQIWVSSDLLACARLSDSIRSGNLLKVKLRRHHYLGAWNRLLICGRRLQMLWTDIYWNRVCAKVYESSKYNWRSSSGD